MVDFNENNVYSKMRRQVRAPWTQEKLGGLLSNKDTLEKLVSRLQDHLMASDVDSLDPSFISRILLATRYHIKVSFLKQNGRLVESLQSICSELAKCKVTSPSQQANWDWTGIINSICDQVQKPMEDASSFFKELGVDTSILRIDNNNNGAAFVLPDFARVLSRDLISKSSCVIDRKLKVRNGHEIKFYKPKAPQKRATNEKREHSKVTIENSPNFRKRNEQLALKMKQKTTRKRTMKVLNLQEQKRRRIEEQKREQEKLEAKKALLLEKQKAKEELKKKRDEELKKKREEEKAQKAQKVNKTKQVVNSDTIPPVKSEIESNTQSAENNLGNFQIAQALAFQQVQRMRLASMAQQGGASGLLLNPFADPSTAAMYQKQYQQSLLAAQNQRDLADQVKAYLTASGQNGTSLQMQQLLAAQKQGYMASALNQSLLGLAAQSQNKAVSQQSDLFPSQGQMLFPGQSQIYGSGSQRDVTTQSRSDSAAQGIAANSNPMDFTGMLRAGNDETDPFVKLEKKEEQGGELQTAQSSENVEKKCTPKEVPIATTQSQPVAQAVPESIVEKYPWLFKDCNRLTPANRDYLIKFLEGIIPATKEEKQYDVLLNEESDSESNIVQLIFRFSTGSRTWKMLKRKIRKPS